MWVEIRTKAKHKNALPPDSIPLSHAERCMWWAAALFGVVGMALVLVAGYLLLTEDDTTSQGVIMTTAPSPTPFQISPEPAIPISTAAPLQSPTPTALGLAFPTFTLPFSPTPPTLEALTLERPPDVRLIPNIAAANGVVAVARATGVQFYAAQRMGAAPTVCTLPNIESLSVDLTATRRDALIGTADGRVLLCDLESGGLSETIRSGNFPIWAVAYNPSGSYFVAGTADGLVRLWDIDSGRELRLLSTNAELVQSVAVHPQDSQLLAGTYLGNIQVWDGRSYEQIGLLEAHAGYVWSVQYHPNGLSFASAGADGRVVLWDSLDLTEIHTFDAHTGSANDAAFSDDGQRLASVGDDGMVYIWDMTTRREIMALEYDVALTAVAFFDNNTQLVAGARDGALLVWDALRGGDYRRLPGR